MIAHEYQTRRRSLPLALIITVGAWAAWFFVVGIVISIVEQWGQSRVYEYLQVERSGNVIVEQNNQSGNVRSFRTLDGKPIVNRPENTVSSSTLGLVEHNPYQRAVDWYWQIVSYSDMQLPAGYWYLMTDGQPLGNAYFVGFDSATNLCIGYIGRNGFRPEPPPVSDQFPIYATQLSQNTASTMYFRPGYMPYDFNNGEHTAIVHLLSNGKLLRINLAARSVEPVHLQDDIQSISSASIHPEKPGETKVIDCVVARANGKLFLVDYSGAILRTLTIPPELAHSSFELYAVDDSASIIVGQENPTSDTSQIFWMDKDDKITRQVEVLLQGGYHGDPETAMAWWAAPFLASPISYAILMSIAPLEGLRSGHFASYSTALAHYWSVAWPAFLALSIVSALLAVWCYRRHQRYSEHGTAIWFAFVCLLGWPGLIGYLLHRRWPVMERCQHCGKDSPRDRDACLHCATEFPPPAMKGIEIFA